MVCVVNLLQLFATFALAVGVNMERITIGSLADRLYVLIAASCDRSTTI